MDNNPYQKELERFQNIQKLLGSATTDQERANLVKDVESGKIRGMTQQEAMLNQDNPDMEERRVGYEYVPVLRNDDPMIDNRYSPEAKMDGVNKYSDEYKQQKKREREAAINRVLQRTGGQ